MKTLIHKLPKIELHLHIEGTLEPEMMFALSRKNNIPIPYANVEEIKKMYDFHNLQSFLDLYYTGASVLVNKQDFFDLTWAYLLKCKENNVIHTEIFFDPQTHSVRGIELADVIDGISEAMNRGREELGISSYLIACILRHLSQEEGLQTLRMILPFRDKIIAIGLDSSEVGHPPSKFTQLFKEAQKEGFLLVAHAGEEGDSSYIWEALQLGVHRIDHGVRCEEDEKLITYLREKQIPLTVCPLSNLKLKVFKNPKDLNVVKLLREGLCVTINSDDPSYFGGYINANFEVIAQNFEIREEELLTFSLNALQATFLPQQEKENLRQQIINFKNIAKS
ncbi:adenosine deaminase [Helicobacter cholecystus]|uniref:Adenine deaminase n=1 Tax=Helicobacter cholecystus TaxID=45498 RepID=A0A3D8IWA2_9HELI|nr:adenosine deaminase [Helicobacter cholecystus]RDU69260.1 adenosine deaminase [Helicobacter cholecystus]VEJ24338.1 Adenine deaminase [Helicobacter cholecystus]